MPPSQEQRRKQQVDLACPEAREGIRCPDAYHEKAAIAPSVGTLYPEEEWYPEELIRQGSKELIAFPTN